MDDAIYIMLPARIVGGGIENHTANEVREYKIMKLTWALPLIPKPEFTKPYKTATHRQRRQSSQQQRSNQDWRHIHRAASTQHRQGACIPISDHGNGHNLRKTSGWWGPGRYFVSTKNKIVATRHVSWTENIPKMLFVARACLEPRRKSLHSSTRGLPPTHEPYLPLLPSRKAPSPFGCYSLRLPTKGWPGWVDLGGWPDTETNVPRRELNPDTVGTHPSTNRDQRRLTWLIETNVLPLRQTAAMQHRSRIRYLSKKIREF